MNKSDLVKTVAYEAELRQRDADFAVTAVFDAITRALSKGERVVIAGFGTFEVRERAERTQKLPDGEEIVIPAHKAPVFKAGTMLKNYVDR